MIRVTGEMLKHPKRSVNNAREFAEAPEGRFTNFF